MKTIILTVALGVLFATVSWVVNLTGEQLAGKWEFMYWAECYEK